MPQRARNEDEAPAASAAAQVFAKNLRALMAAHPSLNSNPKLSKKTGLATSSMSRLLNGKVDATLDTVEKIAQAFQVEPWQLLVPDIQPANMPVLQPVTAAERRLYDRLREVAKEIKDT